MGMFDRFQKPKETEKNDAFEPWEYAVEISLSEVEGPDL